MRSPKPAVLLLFAVACGPSIPGTGSPNPTRSTVRLTDFEVAEFLTEGDRVSATLPVSPADAWAILPGVFEVLGIPVSENVPGRMTLGNERYRARRVEGKRMGRFLDCGTSPSGVLADLYDVTLSITTRVMEGPEGGAILTTTVDAWAEPRMTRGDPIRCRSKGSLEQRVEEILVEKLGVGESFH